MSTQRRFVLDASGLPDRQSRRGERHPLPPRAGPSFLPMDHHIQRADRGARRDRVVIKGIWPEPFRCEALRVGNGAAQPARQREEVLGRRFIAKRMNSGGAFCKKNG